MNRTKGEIELLGEALGLVFGDLIWILRGARIALTTVAVALLLRAAGESADREVFAATWSVLGAASTAYLAWDAHKRLKRYRTWVEEWGDR